MTDIAIIGAGRIGRIHAHNAAPQGLRARYVVDPVASSAQALAAAVGATTATLEQVLADKSIAGVVIASSTDTHLDYTVRFIRAGKAVFFD
jgi:myo-inositol 2-dehydrogenase/D-chiro-inositol 1-dehydrogenase